MKANKSVAAWSICLFMVSWGIIQFLKAVETGNITKMITAGIGAIIFLVMLISLIIIRIKTNRTTVK